MVEAFEEVALEAGWHPGEGSAARRQARVSKVEENSGGGDDGNDKEQLRGFGSRRAFDGCSIWMVLEEQRVVQAMLHAVLYAPHDVVS